MCNVLILGLVRRYSTYISFCKQVTSAWRHFCVTHLLIVISKLSPTHQLHDAGLVSLACVSWPLSLEFDFLEKRPVFMKIEIIKCDVMCVTCDYIVLDFLMNDDRRN